MPHIGACTQPFCAGIRGRLGGNICASSGPHLERRAKQIEWLAVGSGCAIGIVASNPALDGIGMQQVVLDLGRDVLLVDLQPFANHRVNVVHCHCG